VSKEKKQLPCAYDLLGQVIWRHTIIAYPRMSGHSTRLRMAKVLDIYETQAWTYESPKPRLLVKSIGMDWSNELSLSERAVRLDDPTNTIVVASIAIPKEYWELFERVEVTPYAG
jgi:hypothetical protein